MYIFLYLYMHVCVHIRTTRANEKVALCKHVRWRTQPTPRAECKSSAVASRTTPNNHTKCDGCKAQVGCEWLLLMHTAQRTTHARAARGAVRGLCAGCGVRVCCCRTPPYACLCSAPAAATVWGTGSVFVQFVARARVRAPPRVYRAVLPRSDASLSSRPEWGQ